MCRLFAITLRKVVNFSLKAKLLKIKSEGVGTYLRLFLFCFLTLVVFIGSVNAQTEKNITVPKTDLGIKKDTLITSAKQSQPTADSATLKKDSLKQVKKGDIETTIYYSARDSINSDLKNKIIKLFGSAKVKYGEIELEAEDITIDYDKSTLTAGGRLDSTGRRVGFPIFKNGQQSYETKDIVYNFKTKRAKISEVVTKEGEGFIHGDKVYKNEKNNLLSITNAYTTCNLATPHFRIISTKAKAIPGDKMISGPFYMEFNGVPTPLGFAFGIFPSQRQSASGLIIPAYGEERVRGFFLRNGGYFFDINDYFKMSITSDIYSKGSTALYLKSNYKKRYKYAGSFNISYTSNRLSDNIESTNRSNDYQVTWSHSPQTRGTGRFSASVNAATSSYSTNNFLGVINPASTQTGLTNNSQQKLSSNVSYSKTFGTSPFSMGINMRINQDLKTKQVDLPLPDMNFNMNNIYPFKKFKGSMALENLSLRISGTAINQITNNLGKIKTNKADASIDSIAPFDFTTLPSLIRNANKGIRFAIPLSTSIKVLKFFTLSPSLNWDEIWYFDKLTWAQSQDSTQAIKVVSKTPGFNRVSTYSASVSINTRIYGTVFFKKGSIKAIRHVVNPSISMSFKPDFGDPSYGYYQRFDYISNKTKPGRAVTEFKSRHDGFVYGSAPQGSSSSLGFGINNNIERKVRGKKDTVDRKVALFNTLSISGGYNFLKDTMKLTPLSLSANSNVLNNKINLNASATLDPYQYLQAQTYTEKGIPVDGVFQEYQVNRLAWSKGSLGRITNANFAFGTNLSPKGQKKDNELRDKVGKSNAPEGTKQHIMAHPDAYVDFTIPWNLRFNYNANYTHNISSSPVITQSITFNGDLSLSEKWKIVFNSGYDIKLGQITNTSLSLNRDLHCWQTSLSWIPFGKFQSYNFTIGIKSSLLQDLKLNRTRSFQDN
jgi:lipopolysaccharide export system protein LptA